MITKRQLGWLLILMGLGGDLALLTVGRLGGGAWAGIGPLERAMLIAGLGVATMGLPLLRLRPEPAALAAEPDYRLPDEPGEALGHRPRWIRWLAWALRTLVLIALAAYLAVYITYAMDLFRWPYDYDQGESFELYDAVLHSQGDWPYRDSSTFPFYASNYPPVFHILNTLLFPVLGQTLLSGRVLSFAITLMTAALIGFAVWRRTGGWFLPAASGAAYLASNFVYHVGPLCRQHLLMVFLELLCVTLIANAGSPQGGNARHYRRNVLLGLLCLFLAGYSKQLAVFTAAAVFGYLFLQHPLRALKLVVAFGAAFGAVFLLINWATGGYWWVNTISANVNEFLTAQLIGLTRTWLRIHIVYILLAGAMVLYETYWDRLSVYSLWFVAAIGTGILSGKWGAGEAYWITSVAAAITLSGFALGRLRTWVMAARLAWRPAVAFAIPLVLLFQMTRMVHLPTEGPVWGQVARALGVAGQSAYADYPYYDAVGYSQVGHLMLPRDYVGGAKIMDYVRSTTLPVLSEEAAFTMLAGKPTVTNPTQLLNLYNNGMLDTGELETMIRDQAFGLVIMRAQFYPPPVLAAIGKSYGLVEHIPMNGFNYIIMKPLTAPQGEQTVLGLDSADF
ncbi:MAG: hypothetical protein JXC32_05825 [Anaerolineae bacterium]|nr:hypothetical protein [Anaerolineae bacterium]